MLSVASLHEARASVDIDLLIEDSPENVSRVKQGLRILADNAAADIDDADVQRHVIVRVADEIVVDLMGRACGATYADAVRDAEPFEILGQIVPEASRATLIRTKQTVRPSGAADVAFLERSIAEDEESQS